MPMPKTWNDFEQLCATLKYRGRPGAELTEIQAGSARKARFCGISQRGRDRVPLPFHEHSD